MVFKQFTPAEKAAFAKKQAALKGKGGKPAFKGKSKFPAKKKAFTPYSK